MDIEQKIKEDMEKMGCKCKRTVALAYQLFLHLVDEKLMHNVEYFYNKEIEVMFLTAKPSKNGKPNIYLPFPSSKDIDMNYISKLQSHLCNFETGCTINIAIIDSDSTIVIYNFTSGLIDLKDPDCLSRRRTREERRNFIDSELFHNREKIVQSAFDGGNIKDGGLIVLDGGIIN